GSRRHLQADPGGPQAPVEPAGPDPAPQAHRAAGVRQRRAVLGGLRPRRGLHHAVGRGHLGVRLLLAGRARRRPGDGDRGGVVPPERARLPQRRRGLRGGDGQPRPDRRGHRRQRPARRLRPDRRGVGLLGRAERGRRAAVRLRSRGDLRLPARPRAHRAQPPRRAGVGRAVRHPHLRLHAGGPRDGGVGCAAAVQRHARPGGERVVAAPAGGGLRRGDQLHRAGLPAGTRILVRLRGADRRRGDLQRRPGVPQAEEPQRRDHAVAAGVDRDRDAHEHHRAGTRDGTEVRRPGRPRPAAPGERRAAARRVRPAHRAGPARPGGLLRPRPRVLLRHHDDRRHPPGRGQHRVQRLPGARLDAGQGRFPAASARRPWGPAGLQQRDRHPRAVRDAAHRGLRRRGHPPHPALHRRGLRLLHAQPARHDAALDAPPAHRDQSRRAAPDAPLPGDQRVRVGDDRARARHRARHEVPRGRVDRDPGDGQLLPPHAEHPPPLRPGRQRARHRGGGPAAPDPRPRDRAGVQGPQADDAGAGLRQGEPPQRPRGGAGEHRPGRARPDRRRVGPAQHRRPAEDPRLAVPRGHPADRPVHPRHPRGAAARRRRRLHPRVRRGPLVGTTAAQPDRVPAQGPAALQPGGDGDLGALPALLRPPRRAPRRAARRGARRTPAPRLGRGRPPPGPGM
ncbi:MAG: Uncharacterized amino acid permease, GabP family, partial [uncultured Nocardioidaceae bacterium]